MNLARLLRPELIRLELETVSPSPEELDGVEPDKLVLDSKERVLREIVGLLAESGRVAHENRLFTDLFNREKRAGTGLRHGIAVPHVRTAHAKEFLFAFARSTAGVEFGCIDGEPAHLFFILVAPPYDDQLYLKIYKKLAEAFSFSGFDLTREFLEARDEGEVLRAVRAMDG